MNILDDPRLPPVGEDQELSDWWEQLPADLQMPVAEAVLEYALETDYDFYMPLFRQQYRELMHRLTIN